MEPEMPRATYSLGVTVRPVWPTILSKPVQPRSYTGRVTPKETFSSLHSSLSCSKVVGSHPLPALKITSASVRSTVCGSGGIRPVIVAVGAVSGAAGCQVDTRGDVARTVAMSTWLSERGGTVATRGRV